MLSACKLFFETACFCMQAFFCCHIMRPSRVLGDEVDSVVLLPVFDLRTCRDDDFTQPLKES